MTVATDPPVSPMLSRGELRLSAVVTDPALDALEAEWVRLVDRSPATVFQTYEWVRAWWGFFGRGRRLHCLVFRDGDRVVGIAPLVREPVTLGGLPVATRLRFLGCPHSAYLDVVVEPGYEDAVAARLASHLRSTARDWDVFDVDAASEDSVLFRRLPDALEREAIALRSSRVAVCPEVRLPGSWEAFLGSLGANGRSNFRRKLKRLEERYQVEIEKYRDARQELPDAVEAFATLHEQRWRSLGYPSAVRDRSFYVDVARRFARRGWLRLSFLKVDDLRVAVSLDFHYRERIYSYLAHAHGPADIMRYSPGFLLMCLAVRQAIEEGLTVYDLLTGDESYKYERFKAVDRPIWRLRALSPARPIRRRVFVAGELVAKMGGRLAREYYDLRRRRSVGRLSSRQTAGLVLSRVGRLTRLGLGYVRQNLR